MRLKQWFRGRYDRAIASDTARQLGVALTAAGVIGYFLDPATGVLATVPVGIGLVFLHFAAQKPRGDL